MIRQFDKYYNGGLHRFIWALHRRAFNRAWGLAKEASVKEVKPTPSLKKGG